MLFLAPKIRVFFDRQWRMVKGLLFSERFMNHQLEQITVKIRAADPALDDQAMLSDAEHDRLAGMHEGARPSFVTARAMLRRELGTYMDLPGFEVPLRQKAAGRITIDGFEDSEPPFYSVSHSGSAEAGIAAIAVSNSIPIGIDIQQIDYHIDWKRVAERRFPTREWKLLNAMPENEGRMLFFTYWAIKEACVKMENGTLMPYLRGIEIEFQDGKFTLVSPTPGGVSEITIFFHFLAEFELAVACVCKKEAIVSLDCDIKRPDIRPNSLYNT